jgi:hypothetical protein
MSDSLNVLSHLIPKNYNRKQENILKLNSCILNLGLQSKPLGGLHSPKKTLTPHIKFRFFIVPYLLRLFVITVSKAQKKFSKHIHLHVLSR